MSMVTKKRQIMNELARGNPEMHNQEPANIPVMDDQKAQGLPKL